MSRAERGRADALCVRSSTDLRIATTITTILTVFADERPCTGERMVSLTSIMIQGSRSAYFAVRSLAPVHSQHHKYTRTSIEGGLIVVRPNLPGVTMPDG